MVPLGPLGGNLRRHGMEPYRRRVPHIRRCHRYTWGTASSHRHTRRTLGLRSCTIGVVIRRHSRRSLHPETCMAHTVVRLPDKDLFPQMRSPKTRQAEAAAAAAAAEGHGRVAAVPVAIAEGVSGRGGRGSEAQVHHTAATAAKAETPCHRAGRRPSKTVCLRFCMDLEAVPRWSPARAESAAPPEAARRTRRAAGVLCSLEPLRL
mmetsp:Transcript_115593/g.333954  ORF Transcript_115593/g.333954 Transcript_115593/m.333954 type:complete len:206 (+) Transcript_115593:387-1004(+)